MDNSCISCQKTIHPRRRVLECPLCMKLAHLNCTDITLPHFKKEKKNEAGLILRKYVTFDSLKRRNYCFEERLQSSVFFEFRVSFLLLKCLSTRTIAMTIAGTRVRIATGTRPFMTAPIMVKC